MTFLKKNHFVLSFLLVFLVADFLLTSTNPLMYVETFNRNDMEITKLNHPEQVWDKVIWGNSVVAAGFSEEFSETDYINFGLVYGVLTDLKTILEKKQATIGSELVLGLNYLAFYDDFETNPTYLWHKGAIEPYAYFERDRLGPFIKDGVANTLQGLPFTEAYFKGQQKYLCHGNLPPDELAEKVEEYRTKYWNLDISRFQKNMEALDWILTYCEKENIRVRAVWMPWNPDVEIPQLVYDLEAQADGIFAAHGVEVADMKGVLEPACFYDTGHLDYEYGAKTFTKLLDAWLVS